MKFPGFFTKPQQQVLERIHGKDQLERQSGSTDPLRLKALRPAVAQFVCALALGRRARRIAEFGTSAGYSTLHLAAAAARAGGTVHSLDRAAEKTAWAQKNLEEAGLAPHAELFTGNCADFVEALPEGLDFVLLDFGAGPLLPHLAALKAKMGAGAFFFADGGPEDMWRTHEDYIALRESFEADPAFLCLPLYLEKHQLLVTKTPA